MWQCKFLCTTKIQKDVFQLVIKTANRIVGFYSIYNRVNEIRWQILRTGSRNVTYFTSKRIKYYTETFKNINFCNILPIYTEIISKTSVLSSNKPHFSWNYCSCTRTESFTAWLQLGVYYFKRIRFPPNFCFRDPVSIFTFDRNTSFSISRFTCTFTQSFICRL